MAKPHGLTVAATDGAPSGWAAWRATRYVQFRWLHRPDDQEHQ